MSVPSTTAPLTGVTGATVRSVMDRPKPGPAPVTIHATTTPDPRAGVHAATLCGRTLLVRAVRPVDWPATVASHWTTTCRRCITLSGQSAPTP